MGATPLPHSHEGSLPGPEKGLINSLYDFLYKLFKESPRWIQFPVLFAIAAFGVIYALQFLGFIKPPVSGKTTPAYSLTDGTQAPGPGNAAMADTSIHIAEEDAHAKWHNEHPEDSPPMKIIFKISEDNYLGYRFYDKSDRCVFVLRKENDSRASRWIKDPLQDASLHSSENRKQTRPADQDTIASLLDAFIPTAQAAPQAGVRLQRVQVGCVQGTHPGQFTWWWGTPEDQCWAPMYRKWADGCEHYQRYNKCANSWDDRIDWVSCSAGPHS
jgi:hypothetical protein